jgi:hypothetical protein
VAANDRHGPRPSNGARAVMTPDRSAVPSRASSARAIPTAALPAATALTPRSTSIDVVSASRARSVARAASTAESAAETIEDRC